MPFQFKQFSVEDKGCAMKVGTDGCLIGAWTDTAEASHLLDIGTGSGVISLMLAQRCNASIDAIEIDHDAWKQATENFIASPWTERLKAIHSPMQAYVKSCTKKYDLIVSCPPYFLNSLKAPDKKRNLARHTDSLTFEELLSGSIQLLTPKGKLCVILPSDSAKLFCDLAIIQGLYTTKVTQAEPKEGAKPVRTLIQLERTKKQLCQDTIAILDSEGKTYTPGYKEFMKEYYLNF